MGHDGCGQALDNDGLMPTPYLFKHLVEELLRGPTQCLSAPSERARADQSTFSLTSSSCMLIPALLPSAPPYTPFFNAARDSTCSRDLAPIVALLVASASSGSEQNLFLRSAV
jgi:hypothetical protein